MPYKLAVVLSHPIQHFAPQFRSWTRRQDVTIKVFYASTAGWHAYKDPNFDRVISWGAGILDGYESVFLNGTNELPRSINARLDAPSLAQHLEEFGPDGMLIFGYAHLLEHRARFWARRNNVQLIYVADSELRHRAGVELPRWKTTFLRWYLKPFQQILTVGQANEEYYRALGISESRMTRMNFPIDIDLYQSVYESNQDLRSATRRKLKANLETVVVLMVGKVNERKRQLDLVNAVENLDPSCDVQLWIAGTGAGYDQIAAMKFSGEADRTQLLGFVEPSDLPAIYLAADIYAHSSSMDPHPLAVTEATFMGKPAIVSSSCGNWGLDDDVQPRVNGYVYSTGDVSELASTLENLVENPDLRATMGEESRRIALRFQATSHGDFFPQLLFRLWGSTATTR